MDNTANNFSTIAEMFDLSDVQEKPIVQSFHVIRQESYNVGLYEDIFATHPSIYRV